MATTSWDKLPLGVQSFSLQAFNTSEVIKHTQGFGVRNIEFYHGHISPNSPAADVADLKKQLKAAGLSVSAYGLYTFTRNHERNRKAFDFARSLGVKNITADVEPDSFDSLGRLVEEYGIRVGIHTSGPGTRYEKLDTLVNDLKGKHKLIGVCVDTGHILRAGGDPAKWIRDLGDRVFVVHLTDVATTTPQTHSQVLGQGHLNLDAILNSLSEITFPADGGISVGYQGAACARLTTPGLPFDPIVALSQSLRALGVGSIQPPRP
jgi:sugar phosphate isomerase/epimerase